ncbi:MAG: transaldolase family protein [Thermoleophilia bacterium]|jgi:transaldolase|nr:transaldolase family protein [Thermoleophilia bacterium]
MLVLLDSASLDDAAAAARLGYVGGFTTNPTLMARATSLAGATTEPLAHFAALLEALPEGPGCYQPTGDSPEAMCEEARAAASLAPARVVIKLPATADGVRAAATLREESIRCALTAVYSPAQALLAHAVGCVWVIPYVDRAERQGVGGRQVIESLAGILRRLESPTRILAASLKTAEQVTDTVLHGAHDITAPLDVLAALAHHPLTEAAVREFAAQARPSAGARRE